MSEFNFKSQICTTREQSERLLSLGLKRETADMHWYKPIEFEHDYWFMGIGSEWCGVRDVPAWSLHRLIILIGNIACDWIFRNGDCYTNAINCIEWIIKEGHFNKEYLEE